MGLFDRIIKDAVGDKLGKAVGDALEKATGVDINGDGVGGENANLGIPQQGAQQQGWTQSNPTPTQANTASEAQKDHAYFAALLAEKFADYQLQEFAPVSIFGGEGKPYDFVLSQAGKPAIAIMLTHGNRYRGKDFTNAKASAEAAGVPFVNFFLRLPNERGYIINRIKTTLGLL